MPPAQAKADIKKAAPTTAQSDSPEALAQHEGAVGMAQQRYVAIGRLRRDTMILASDESADVINQLASAAVREGRSAEVFVFECAGYFSETEIDFVEAPVAARTLRADQGEARLPLLNPGTGEDSLDVAAASESSAPKANQPTHASVQGGDDNSGAGTGTAVKAGGETAKDDKKS